MGPSPSPRDPRGRFFADVLSFGWVLPAALAAGAGLGWLLDRWLGSFPVATLLLGLAGLAAGLRQILREADTLASEGSGDRPPKGEEPGRRPAGGPPDEGP